MNTPKSMTFGIALPSLSRTRTLVGDPLLVGVLDDLADLHEEIQPVFDKRR